MGVNGERGQASVELVAVLPCILLVAAVVWQNAWEAPVRVSAVSALGASR